MFDKVLLASTEIGGSHQASERFYSYNLCKCTYIYMYLD